MKILRRTIHPEVRILDEKQGVVEYVASDESLDSYNEVIMAGGWKFNRFEKNAPFVDSHNYESIDCLLGKVVDFRVQDKQLIETVKWAKDVPENFLAQKGFAMTAAGYLKAVSVGFLPIRAVSKWDSDKKPWQEALAAIGMHEEDGVRCIYTEQDQMELSACIVGANMNAVAKSFKAGIFSDADLERIASLQFPQANPKRETAPATVAPADVAAARQRARTAWLVELQTHINRI